MALSSSKRLRLSRATGKHSDWTQQLVFAQAGAPRRVLPNNSAPRIARLWFARAHAELSNQHPNRTDSTFVLVKNSDKRRIK